MSYVCYVKGTCLVFVVSSICLSKVCSLGRDHETQVFRCITNACISKSKHLKACCEVFWKQYFKLKYGKPKENRLYREGMSSSLWDIETFVQGNCKRVIRLIIWKFPRKSQTKMILLLEPLGSMRYSKLYLYKISWFSMQKNCSYQ